MPTYWDAFIERYKEELNTVNLRTTLEAFWNYCNGHLLDENDCDKLMGKKY